MREPVTPKMTVGKTRISPMKSTLSQSEKDFIAGQKFKEDYMKKNPGKPYPNTAN
jgi:hypothetical protein